MAGPRIVLVALLYLTLMQGTTSSDVETSGSQKRNAFRVIVGSNQNFTRSLYQILQRTEGNVFFSPMSIQVVLALAAQGAVGDTQQQMITGLCLPEDQAVTRDGFRQLFKDFQKANDSLKIVNKIYTDRRYPPTSEFISVAQKDFQSDGEKLDFLNSADQERQKINRWVQTNTANKITNLIPEGTLGRNTAMVLVNAMYFKGTWKTQFEPANTTTEDFFVTRDKIKPVQMMHVNVRNDFFYKESKELNAQILEMRYADTEISLVIILPLEKHGLQQVEAKLSETDLRSLFRDMHAPVVHVSLPRFKLEQSYELKGILEEMGMLKMFSNAAEFSGLANGPIKVSQVLHKGLIEVNEEGAEAAASTVVVSVTLSAYPQEIVPIIFKADHPFLFMLRHSKTGAILFMGRHSTPT